MSLLVLLAYAYADPGASVSAEAGLPKLLSRTLDGQDFDLQHYAGQPVLLNAWATWCKPCVDELPDLVSLAETNPRLVIVGVAVDPQPEGAAVRDMVARFALPYPIVHSGGLAWARRQGVTDIPMTWLYSASGELLWSHAESFEPQDSAFQAALSQALAGEGASPTQR